MKKLMLLGCGVLLAACGPKGPVNPNPTITSPDQIPQRYAVTDSALYRIDLSGKEADKKIMDLSYSGSITDAAQVNNIIYIATFSELLKADVTTGQLTKVGNFGASDVNALAVDSSNKLYASGLFGNVYQVDTSTGKATKITELGYTSSGDLAINAAGTVYATVVSGGNGDALATMKLSDKKANLIGNTGYNDIYGLDFYNGSLYGRTHSGKILQIDPATAKATLVRDTGLAFTSIN